MHCPKNILSNEVYDYITDFPLSEFSGTGEVLCYEEIDKLYNVVYFDRAGIQNPQVDFFQYQSVPKLYGLMQTNSAAVFNPQPLIAGGITKVQRPPLNLTGRGCVLCFIDTGIAYDNPLFRNEDGSSRILAIWDQTIQTGTPPQGFFYGSEYTKEDIDRALKADDPYQVVPSRDENGHGSNLAALAAGSRVSVGQPYTGAAPDADIVVVKLKGCKEYLRRFYLLPDDVPAYQENDIMLAVRYADSFARILERPVIICLGLGTNMGDHAGSSALSRYLNAIAARRSRAVVVCGGNEGNAAHHFRGNLLSGNNAASDRPSGAQVRDRTVEVRVGENCKGFLLECWGQMPDALRIGLRSPAGETVSPLPINSKSSVTYGFVYGNTRVTLDTILAEPASGEQLARFRLENPTPGIWSFQVSAQSDIYNGIFDMWLPVSQFLDTQVYFLRPDPYITLTEPSLASDVICVASYNSAGNSLAIDSGRGFARTGAVRPDLAAPGENVSVIRGSASGSSFAAAITAGAVAQFFQWAVVEQNDVFAESREIKAYLIRGAARSADFSYPNREWGYGLLDIAGTFEAIAGA